ncbi:PLP-dependent transferase [Exidia glandulosa HHB12029]|uniref:PLP-dependent transferase n=1 Tax=Exidia glandulosa HHB12029 TaxID=1314781 RepID=A0A165EHL7_EXIGL|nr:PLP-dependent transferase [Exidia glandulosa HHB12029]
MHNAVASWFLGPQGESKERLKDLFEKIVESTAAGRLAYHEEDGAFVSTDMMQSQQFSKESQRLEHLLKNFTDLLNKYSVPFFSQRYAGHMCFETSLPAILGYLSTIMTNPNNVAFEASPFTTIVEITVGQQLCEMLGYSCKRDESAWGHITCDGSVANTESMWVARNLKFYPLSLRLAMEKDKLLGSAAAGLKVPTCENPEKPVLFTSLNAWQLLNLRTNVILDLSTLLNTQCGISPEYSEQAMKKYLVQEMGKDALMAEFTATFKTETLKQPQYLISATRHYSWPKAAALTGIGAMNLVSIPVDVHARLKIDVLRKQLQQRFDDNVPVYAVVAVIGTTEEGAVDPLDEVLKLKDEFQAKGMSFVVHADAAWGGYFASMIREPPQKPPVGHLPVELPDPHRGPIDPVPEFSMRKHTESQFRALAHTDSITIDPHKSGYIPYPAGGLCYKDGRMRQLVTWSAPYLSMGSETESIGVFGVEGSKPGAAAAAVFLHHQMVGLHKRGHGALLGEVMWTSSRMSAHWATLSDESTEFTVIPFNEVDANQMRIIRDKIVGKDNATVLKDEEACKALRELGSDLNINAFGCNFRVGGITNSDVEEANILGSCIYKALSIADEPRDVKEVPMFLSSSTFKMDEYGECAEGLKKRMGLETASGHDVFVLRNVAMSPFQSSGGFVEEIARIFRVEVEKLLPPFIKRNTIKALQHNFVVQGTAETGKTIHLVYLPNFYDANCRYQLILSVDVLEVKPGAQIPPDERMTGIPTMCSIEDTTIKDIVSGQKLRAVVTKSSTSHRGDVILGNVRVVKNRSLSSAHRDLAYPEYIHSYLYGTPEEPYMDHAIVRAPNWQLTATKPVELDLEKPLTVEQLKEGVIVKFVTVPERAYQPLGEAAFRKMFRVGEFWDVEVYKDPNPATAHRSGLLDMSKAVLITKGKLASTQWPWVWEGLNAAREPWVKGKLIERPRTLTELLHVLPPVNELPESTARRGGAMPVAGKMPMGRIEHTTTNSHSQLFGRSRQETWADVISRVASM